MNRLALIKWPGSGGGSGSGGTAVQADNGLSVLAGLVVLGQNVGQVLDPAKLLTPREIPFNGQSLLFSGLSSVAGSHLIFKNLNAGNLDPTFEFQNSTGAVSGHLRFTDGGSILIGKNAGATLTGSGSFGIGVGVFGTMTTGFNNIAIGDGAMQGNHAVNPVGSIVIGRDSLDNGGFAVGNLNIIIGHNAFDHAVAAIGQNNISIATFNNSSDGGAVGDNNIIIGQTNVGGGLSNTTIIGNYINSSALITLSNVTILGTTTQNTIIGFNAGAPVADSGDRLQVLGGIKLTVLPISNNPKVPVAWDTITGRLVNASGSTIVFTADNGLNVNAPNNVELGGPLLQNTLITAGLFTLSLFGSHTLNQVLNVANSSSGIGAQIQATSGVGAIISSNTGYAAEFDISPVSANTSEKIINVYRNSTGTPAAGMGGYINYQLKDASNFTQDAGRLQYEWSTATSATRTSLFRLKGVTNAALIDWMTVDSAGGVTSNGTTTGFVAANGVTGISAAGSSFGGSFSSTINPLFANNSSNVNNTNVKGFEVSRQGPYTGAIGAGIYIQFSAIDDLPGVFNTSQISSIITNAVHANRSAKLVFNTTLNGTPGDVFVMFSDGTLNAPGVANWGNFANNAAAITGGLSVGTLYRNGDVVQIVH